MKIILLLTNNEFVKEKWQQLLALDYQIKVFNLVELDALNLYSLIVIDAAYIESLAFDPSIIKQLTTKVLVLGDNWSEEQQVSVLVAGAAGYCDYKESTAVALKAVESILQGDLWMQRHLITKVISSLVQMTSNHTQELKLSQSNATALPENAKAAKLACLSSRELDVAQLIKQGVCNKDIASKLFISERTVKAHLTSIFTKLNVSNRLHLGLLLKEVDH